MAFPQYPRITSHQLGREKLVDTGDSSHAGWLSTTPPSWSAGSATFTSGQRLCSRLSRWVSPFCTEVELDGVFDHPIPASGTSRLRFGLTSSSATGTIFTASNSCVYVESNRTTTTWTVRLVIKQALPGSDPNGSGTAIVSQVCAFTVGRVRLELRKEAWDTGIRAIFRRSSGTPATPADSTEPPASWYAEVEDVPAGGDPIYCSIGERVGTGTTYDWLAPTLLSNNPGLQWVGDAPYRYRLRIYDDSGTEQYDLTGDHTLNWQLWTKADTTDKNDVGNAHAAVVVDLAGATNTVVVDDFNVRWVGQDQTNPTTFGPIIDGPSLEVPHFDATAQPYLQDSKLLPTAAPFSANGSGGGTASTNLTALTNCLKWSIDHSMDVFLGPNVEILVNNTLRGRQWVFQRSNSIPTDRRTSSDETSPASIEGSTQGTSGAKSIIRLADASSGFSDGSTFGATEPFILFDTTPYDENPPGYGTSDNSNYNHQLKNLRVRLGDNPGCHGIAMQGAQGTEAYRLQVDAVDAFSLFYNLPGSGGGLHTLDLDGDIGAGPGTKYLFYVDGSQPVPTITGVYAEGFINNCINVVGPGNRQNLLLVGWGVESAANRTVFNINGGASAPQDGQFEIRDAYIDFASAHANNTLVDTNRSLVLENVWVNNCTKIVEHPSGDITSPSSTGWIHIERIVIPYDPPADNTGGITDPDPFQYQADNYINGSVSTANIVQYGTPAVAPPGDLVDRHRISDAQWLNFEKSDINIAVDHTATFDGITNNTSDIVAALAAASAGDNVYQRRGVALVDTTIDIPAGVNFVWANKLASTIMPIKQATAGAAFGSGSTQVPVLRTAASSQISILAMAPIWKPSSNQTGFGLHVRGGHEIYGTYTLRRSAWGFGGYPGVGTTYDQNTSFIQYTGIANGRTFNLNHGTTNNTIQPYTHFLVQDCTGHVQLYHLNAEHVHNWPGNFAIENSARVTVYGYKGESNYPSFYVKDTQNFLCFGHGGNPSAYIPSGVYPPGTGPSTPQNPDTGYNPEPVDFPPDYTPALFVLENVDNYRISQTQDEGRNTGGHPVFGLGTRADYWHLGAEYDASVVETLLLPPGARPTIWTKGDVYAEETPVLIGDAEDESFTNGESVTITGSGFEASQGTGRVVISPSNNIAGVGVVTQTVTSWSATSVTITAVRSSLAYNTPLYLFIETDSDVSNASGYVVAFEPIASLSHTLYDEDGDAVTNETSIKASIWRNREPSGAPDQELTGLSTNGSGVITFSIEATGLDPGEPVYMLLYKDHATTWKVGAVKVVPTYS